MALARRCWSGIRSPWWAAPLAVALAVGTLARLGAGADGVAFALAQFALVGLAVVDLATRRLPNRVTLPVSAAAVILRASFERSELGVSVVAGVSALAVFALLYVLLRGGLGMGDVKLAGMLGFLLGRAVVPALVLGIIAGGVVSAALLLSGRAKLTSAIAYGPYLALGGSVAILAFHPAALV